MLVECMDGTEAVTLSVPLPHSTALHPIITTIPCTSSEPLQVRHGVDMGVKQPASLGVASGSSDTGAHTCQQASSTHMS